MKAKLKEIFDNKATWLTIGAGVGVILGEKAALIVNGLGSLVMAIL